jgi:2-methylcitrate dehydratase PrpD
LDGSQLVADFVVGLSWDQTPADARRAARMALLDTLGAALVGTETPVSRIAAEVAATSWPGDTCTILLHGRRASAAGAAFANAYAANAIDIDDCALYTKGHPGAQIIPTALALSEALGLSGARLLTAIVVGYEIAHRAARIWHATHDVYQACGSWGSMACAAVASHLMRLDETQTRHALGVAEYHAPNLPMMRDIDHPAMVKHGVGWGAMNGILSADLAQRGFTGIPSLFDFESYQDWVADIGDHYVMADGLAWKRYACCAWDHALILAADQLMTAHDFAVKEIDHVVVETFHEAMRLGTDLPTTTEEAQFNLAWPLAAFIVDGEVGPDQMLAPALARQDIRDLARRVTVVEKEELTRRYRLACRGDPEGSYVSRVTIRLRDGRAFASGPVEGEINYPQRLWDFESLEDKFRWLTARVLEPDHTDRVLDTVREVEHLSDVGDLTAMLS